MARAEKKSRNANQVRNRVKFHRRLRSILERENQLTNVNCHQNKNIDQEELKQERTENETMASNERLRRWALKYNISKRAISELLTILISLGMNWLPKDSRTLLSTPRHVEMSNLTNGKLWYGVFFLNVNISNSCVCFFMCLYCNAFLFGPVDEKRSVCARVNLNVNRILIWK